MQFELSFVVFLDDFIYVQLSSFVFAVDGNETCYHGQMPLDGWIFHGENFQLFIIRRIFPLCELQPVDFPIVDCVQTYYFHALRHVYLLVCGYIHGFFFGEIASQYAYFELMIELLLYNLYIWCIKLKS